MKPSLVWLVVIVIAISGGLYWYSSQQAGVSQLQEPPAAAVAGGIECHESAEYFVVARGRTAMSEPGEDILLKQKSSAEQKFDCEYAVADGDIELAEPWPTYFLGIDGHFVVLDSGTAPHPRGIAVYDLSKKKEVYTDRYNQPTEIGDGTLTYWQPVDTEANASNCSDLEQYTVNYFGAGIERHISLALSTLEITEFGETRCQPRQ